MGRQKSIVPTPPESPKQDAPAAVTGTSRVIVGDGIQLPPPRVETKAKAVDAKAKEKKPDPNKPKDVQVTSSHVIKTIARTSDQNRETRLKELARTDNDVQALLNERNSLQNKLNELTK